MRCASHARLHEYDPGGTAIGADVLLVMDLPAPWPKPVFAHPALHGIEPTTPTPLGPARVLAAVASGEHQMLRRFDRTPDGAWLTTQLRGPEDIAAALRTALAAERVPATAAPVAAATVLVCTQGTHDVCCGIEGTRLAMDISAADAAADVIRVSHTGGHRFAPTAMTLPDGRMWANLDVATYRAIRDRSAPTAELAPQCRGWWGAAAGAAQGAERAVFAAAGWAWEDKLRRVVPLDEDGETTVWEVSGDGERWRVVTAPTRRVPVLSCRAPGGLPAKTATEYRAEIVATP